MIGTLVVVVVLSLSGGPADKSSDKPEDRAAFIEQNG